MSDYTLPDYTVINENSDPTPMPGEVFKPVPDYPGYEISNYGRVISHKRGRPRVIKGTVDKGYIRVDLRRDGKSKLNSVHRLVAQAHIGPPPSDKPHVLHANDIPTDNRLANLRFGTPTENHHDKVLNGNHPHARKTHCKNGHAFVSANTRVYANVGRFCISCDRARNAARYAAKIGRTFDFHEHALDVYMSLTTAPGADMSPVLSAALAA